MRASMGRKRTPSTLIIAAALIAAFVLPAAASAATHWEKSGKRLLKDPVPIDLQGPLTFNTGGSSVACNVNGEGQIFPGNTGELTTVNFDAKSCKVTGTFKKCQVESVKATGPWGLTATEAGNVSIGNLAYTVHFSSCSPGIALNWAANFGTAKAVPDNQSAISHLGLNEVEGEVVATESGTHVAAVLSGELSVTPAAEYGINTSSTSNHWSKEGAALAQSAKIGLNGTLEVGYGGASVSCGASGEATLFPGDEGEISSFGLSNCISSGTKCKVTSTETTAPWTILATAAGKVSISDFAYTLHFTGCTTTTWKVASKGGSLLATPNNQSAISSLNMENLVSLTGWGGEAEVVLKGSLGVTPAGQYGIN